MDFNILKDLITNPKILLFTVLGLITIRVVVYSFFKNTKFAWEKAILSIDWKSLFKRRKDFEYGIEDLKDHKLFNKLKNLKETKRVFYTHGEIDKSKSLAFEFFIKTRLDTTKKCILEIIDKSSNDMNVLELRSLIDKNFALSNIQIEAEMIKKFIDDGLRKSEAYDLFNKFSDIRENSIKKYEELFDDIFSTPTFENNFQLLNVILFVLHINSEEMVNDSVKAFEKVNGIFKDLYR
jgi:hypothetical protein